LPLSSGRERVLTAICALLTIAAHTQTTATAATKPTQPSSTSSSPSSTTAHKKSRKSKHSRKTANWKKHGQQKIDRQRTQQIQEALIREHYLDGESSGVWDDDTEKAMQKYQGDNGWQTKMTPDARALIKLGLGPDQEKLLNPESAMTSAGAKESASSNTTKSEPTNAPAVAAPTSAPAADPPRQ
jgi:hypothetical protein